MPSYAPDKVILCPPFGYVDVAPYESLVHTREVQRLKQRTQLSLVREVCPNSTHTRFAHSLAVMGLTNLMLDNMYQRGFFADDNRDELRRDLSIAALVHDLGHPPYSHATEYALGQLGSVKNHKDRTVDIIKGPLAKAIEDCGSSAGRVLDLLDKKKGDPRGSMVTTKSVGADKIGYLYHDQRQTGHNAPMPGSYRELLPYLCFAHNRVCVEEKAKDFLEGLQRFYLAMWTQVYLRKQAVAFGRVLQKGIELHVRETGLDADSVWDKSEGWLEDALETSPNENVRELYGRVLRRDGLKAAVAFKIGDYAREERRANKPISVVPGESESMRAFLKQYENPLRITELEGLISSELNLAAHDVIVTTVPEPAKLVPEDVLLVDKAGEQAGWLFERSPKVLEELEEKADRFFAIRVMVDEVERRRVSEAPDVVMEIIEEHSGISLG